MTRWNSTSFQHRGLLLILVSIALAVVGWRMVRPIPKAWAGAEGAVDSAPVKINGVSISAPPQKVQEQRFQEIREQSNAGWVAVIPYAFSRPGDPKVYFDGKHQWWGERRVGVVAQTDYAHRQGMKVMIKPHVWVGHSGWIGEYGLDSEELWVEWESNYSAYILHFARLADSLNAAMFCLSTEAERAVRERPQFWNDLIDSIRTIYNGPLTYAANWDNYRNIPFWNKLDYIGIDAYFPLTAKDLPDTTTLIKAWTGPKEAIQLFQAQVGKPVLFTEFGYLSVPGCAGQTWILEAHLPELTASSEAQANAYSALFASFWSEDWFAGGFLWKWYLHPDAGGLSNTDYTPQGKPVLDIIRRYFRKVE